MRRTSVGAEHILLYGRILVSYVASVSNSIILWVGVIHSLYIKRTLLVGAT